MILFAKFLYKVLAVLSGLSMFISGIYPFQISWYIYFICAIVSLTIIEILNYIQYKEEERIFIKTLENQEKLYKK